MCCGAAERPHFNIQPDRSVLHQNGRALALAQNPKNRPSPLGSVPTHAVHNFIVRLPSWQYWDSRRSIWVGRTGSLSPTLPVAILS